MDGAVRNYGTVVSHVTERMSEYAARVSVALDMSMGDFVTCAFGKQAEQVAMVRRWIDCDESLWASSAIDGINVHIHAVTRDGLDAGVNLAPAEAAVLADYALSRGHKDAERLARVCREKAP